MIAASVSDYRTLARMRLPRFLFEYIDGGSYDEVTLRRNRSDLEAVALRQRVLRNVATLDTSTTLFGERYSLPLGLAPVGIAGLNARRGEIQAVRAAERCGVPFCLSTVSACSLEEVAQHASRPFWFQLYMIRDRAFMAELMTRAWQAGCRTMLFTVDMPLPGSRYRDVRSGLANAPGLRGSLRRALQAVSRPAWFWDVVARGRPLTLGNIAPLLGRKSGLEDFFAWMRANFDPSVTWAELEWVRARWQGTLVVKGVLDAQDAREATNLGADGLVVSNHGGRQLDGTPSTARALPAIADAVGGKTTLIVDGGIRSGLDVARMKALGADSTLIGRPWVFALAAKGEQGVAHVLSLMSAELQVALALTGHVRAADLSRSALADL
jgi:L-lactate dehydrogenase (cytochrome)